MPKKDNYEKMSPDFSRSDSMNHALKFSSMLHLWSIFEFEVLLNIPKNFFNEKEILFINMNLE